MEQIKTDIKVPVKHGEKAETENLPEKSNKFKKESRDTIRILFEGDVALKLIEIETKLKQRNPKSDLGKLLSGEIMAIPETRIDELLDAETSPDYYVSLIRTFGDQAKAIKILRLAARRLSSEGIERKCSSKKVKDVVSEVTA
jgi:hypothetical protein